MHVTESCNVQRRGIKHCPASHGPPSPLGFLRRGSTRKRREARFPLKLQDPCGRRICSNNALPTLARRQPGAGMRADVPSTAACVSPAPPGSVAGAGWGRLRCRGCVSPAPWGHRARYSHTTRRDALLYFLAFVNLPANTDRR